MASIGSSTSAGIAAPPASSGFKADFPILFDTLYALRMELTFLVAFAVFWICSRLASSRTDRSSAKRRPASFGPGIGAKRPSPATVGTSASAGTRAAARAAVGGELGATGDAGGGGGGGRRRLNAGGSLGDLDVSRPKPAQLCDPRWILAAVQQLSRVQSQRAIDLFRSALAAGLDLKAMPESDAAQLFMTLVSSSIRVGQADEALRILRECRTRGPGVTISLLSSAVKLCTSKHFFKECIEIFDYVIEDKGLTVEDRSIWSCLLFCAVESHQHSRCDLFFDRLRAVGAPSQKDFGNMVRAASSQGDWSRCLQLIEDMGAAGVEVDSVIYNTALATCVAASQTDKARELLAVMEGSGERIADVITYNTLAKGYGRAGQLDKCFELYSHMRAQDVSPSQVTYGILLDCCINERQMDRAAEVFDTMTKDSCIMNTVLYTTLIKGFARAEQVDQAMKVYEQMRADAAQGINPDLITFSILIKANCDAGRMDTSLHLLEAMMDLHLVPDEVVFNNLLSGCVRTADAELGRRLYRNMVEGGLRPSSATFSILIRLYAACKQLDEAVEMLKLEPSARGVEPETRLYIQLAQACLRERQGRRAVEVYKMLLGRSAPTAAMHSGLLGMCVKLNMLDTGYEILALAAEARGRVDPRDATSLREAAFRKKKSQLANSISEAMQTLGLAE